MDSGIYCIKNTITGERYIGGSDNMPARQYSHFSMLGSNKHHSTKMQEAYTLYGRSAFVFQILEECESGQLAAREKHWSDTLRPEYNAPTTTSRRVYGRPAGSGAGYKNMVRVLLTDDQFDALKSWQSDNGSPSESDAARRLIVESLDKRPGRAKAGKP